jgi:UDP-MurNAc hydroxylase
MTERVIIEAGGVRYSINRFCPHEGGDLSKGWVEENRYLVCPRHSWKYDLMNEGKCTSSTATINAICLEND